MVGTATAQGAGGWPAFSLDFSAYTGTGTLSWQRTQRVFEAMAHLQEERARIVGALERRQRVAARIVGRGPKGINQALVRTASTWRTLESIRHSGTVGQLRTSLPNNAILLDAGLRMTSVWNHSGLDPDARLVLAGEDPSVYLFGFAPLQMKIIDGTSVLLDGPTVCGSPTVIDVRDAGCLTAARAYWDAVLATTYPCDAETAALTELTPRQRRIVTLMLTSSTDEEIAHRLDVSVRTVRADIATVLELLDAPTRFAAGVRLRERLGMPAAQ
ncbi:sigma factor-like helix-turn-helix DNA-binding protein [Promicromonospora citrea]|uniref:HTH luxR-type domain-containing protein n=1 Tax=Promicromonospora citrea TaxID=43677 RepID=A0A8H9GLI1_9MICO|nr:sigma factor-like helix-turn-helix DNA-binding protein [Promicromonospora citrea]NNH51023.1 response regulator transcription factor [Promicromonospora citrea]GGM29634.1 hypothetical protein GCM10010102_26510 [Promicromonospora citrea]